MSFIPLLTFYSISGQSELFFHEPWFFLRRWLSPLINGPPCQHFFLHSWIMKCLNDRFIFIGIPIIDIAQLNIIFLFLLIFPSDSFLQLQLLDFSHMHDLFNSVIGSSWARVKANGRKKKPLLFLLLFLLLHRAFFICCLYIAINHLKTGFLNRIQGNYWRFMKIIDSEVKTLSTPTPSFFIGIIEAEFTA